MITRRRVLECAAATAGLALLPRFASALSLEPMSAEKSALYAQGCSASPQHTALLAEARAQLGHEPDAATMDRLAAELKATARCPLCGCPIATEAAR